jgi:hypothetical protein
MNINESFIKYAKKNIIQENFLKNNLIQSIRTNKSINNLNRISFNDIYNNIKNKNIINIIDDVKLNKELKKDTKRGLRILINGEFLDNPNADKLNEELLKISNDNKLLFLIKISIFQVFQAHIYKIVYDYFNIDELKEYFDTKKIFIKLNRIDNKDIIILDNSSGDLILKYCPIFSIGVRLLDSFNEEFHIIEIEAVITINYTRDNIKVSFTFFSTKDRNEFKILLKNSMNNSNIIILNSLFNKIYDGGVEYIKF